MAGVEGQQVDEEAIALQTSCSLFDAIFFSFMEEPSSVQSCAGAFRALNEYHCERG